MSLQARNVCLRHGSTEVLSDVSTEVRAGFMTALVGPNGAGKSSLIRLLSGDLTANAGTVCWNETSLHRIPLQQQARLRSVMTQSSHIVFDFLVEDVLRMAWIQGDRWHSNVMLEALGTVLGECDIASLLNRKFNTLSGGEQQRVQFARALLQIWQPENSCEPRFLLLDEPTSNLDLAHELRILNRARQAADHGIGVLVVLHDLNLAARFADDVVLLANGSVVAIGVPTDVFQAQTLTEVYRTPVYVEQHATLDRLVIYS